MPVKRDRKLSVLKNPRNGQHPERDRMRSERDAKLHNMRPSRDKTGSTSVHTRIFLIRVSDVLKHLKNETLEERDCHEFR